MPRAESIKYEEIPIDTMNQQINLRLPKNLLTAATKQAKKQGYGTTQEFIKETLREKLFPDFTKRELDLMGKYAEHIMKHGEFGTEEELWEALK